MTKEYTWWNLCKAQYSWKNDRIGLFIFFILSFIISFIHLINGDVTYTDSGDPVEILSYASFILWVMYFILLTTIYHIFKFIILGCIVCGGATYFANDEDDLKIQKEARQRYNELLTWRK